MAITDLPSQSLKIFPGEHQILDAPAAVSRGAQVAKNVEFPTGSSVRTRRGFGEAFTPATPLFSPSFYNWLSGQYNRIMVLHEVSGVMKLSAIQLHATPIVTENIIASLTPAPAGMSGASSGSRFYFAFYDALGQGVGAPKVWDGSYTNGSPNIDDLFQRPLTQTEFTITANPVDVPSGHRPLTVGQHNLGVVFTTRNGYESRPSPTSSGSTNFVPFTFFADGAHAYSIRLTPTASWPMAIAKASILLATEALPDLYYFVPLAEAFIFSGGNSPVSIIISDSDTTLATATRSATSWFSKLSQSSTGSQPFATYDLIAGNNRLAYLIELTAQFGGTESGVMISDPESFQSGSLSQNLLHLPDKRYIRAAAWAETSIYLFSGDPYGTFSWRDNNDKPVTWGTPKTVDGTIGTRWKHGVTRNPTRGYLWVAANVGLTYLAGAYPIKPVSYEQGARDWRRINLKAPPGALKLFEDPETFQVFVLAPLDSATTPTHLLVWNYAEAGSPLTGIDYRKVRYSWWELPTFLRGGADMVLNPTTGKVELWLSQTGQASSNLIRLKRIDEPQVYEDLGQGIAYKYRTPPVVYTQKGELDFHAALLRLRGSGDCMLQAFGLDASSDSGASPEIVTLNSAPGPGGSILYSFDLQSQACHIDISTVGQLGAWFDLTDLEVFYDRIADTFE